MVLAIFRHTEMLPRDQRFILKQQLQRAALSVSCNIVEGCARRTLPEYRHFVNVALASARETQYLIMLITELQLWPAVAADECRNRCSAVVGSLQNLLGALDRLP